MTDQQFADAKWRFQSYATHSDGCEYITTLRESFITRPRGKVSECDCWNGSTLAALDYAEKRIAELEAENTEMKRMLAEPSENQALRHGLQVAAKAINDALGYRP